MPTPCLVPSAGAALKPAPLADPTRAQAPEADGRRRRSQDSRSRIAQAMLDLVAAGDDAPSAERVAERAGVGLRTVFRLYRDMDGLYAQMSGAIESAIRAAFERPLQSNGEVERLMELLDRRARLFESIAPYKRAAIARRHDSPFLRSGHDRFTGVLTQLLRANLPEGVDADRREALDLLCSWEAWSRLRLEQGLSPERARTVLKAAVRGLLD